MISVFDPVNRIHFVRGGRLDTTATGTFSLHCRRTTRRLLVTNIAVFYRSSIGKKFIVAITGIILILFVIGHLLGNLQIFLGPDWVNGYAQHLRDLGALLWMVRIVLLITVILHIYFTIQLAIENRRARPKGYAKERKREGELRFASHGGERDRCFRVHHFSSAAFYRAHDRSALSAVEKRSAQPLRRLFHDGLRLSECLHLGVLC